MADEEGIGFVNNKDLTPRNEFRQSFASGEFTMISAKDREVVLAIARKYHVPTVLLFGSSLADGVEARDIDIAIEGLADADYFTFYGALLCALSKPVDVVDLSKKSKFTEMVRREGVRLDA